MKSKFIKSTIILIIGGAITKILGMVIKIAMTRVIGSDGISLYMLIMPTFNLFITLCTMGMPIAISKLVSENKRRSKKIILSTVPIIIIFNLILIAIIFLIAKTLANDLLQNPNTYLPIIATSLTLPFISISSLLKGYFFGKEKMFPHTLSNIVEQITRLILTIIITPYLLSFSLKIAITGIILINIASEFVSILVLISFIPKNTKIEKEDFKYDKDIMKDMLNISIPTTGTRLIGSLVYFLEPIILTFTLTKIGYTNSYITLEYGILNGYVYPLLLIPSFFTLAISNALLPVVSNSYARGKYDYTKKKIKQSIFFSLLIGIPVTLIFIFIPNVPLQIIYNTTLGSNYLPIIAPFFLLHYIQAPLTSAMQAMNKAKDAMIGTLIGSFLKLVLIFGISLFKVGLLGYVIASIVNIAFTTVHHLYYVRKSLNNF